MTDETKTDTPQGVVGIFVGPDGRCIASVSDFDHHGYGGYTQQEAQTHRVRDAIARAVADALASSEFTKHIDKMERDEADKRMRKVHASDRLRLLFGEYQRFLLELLSHSEAEVAEWRSIPGGSNAPAGEGG